MHQSVTIKSNQFSCPKHARRSVVFTTEYVFLKSSWTCEYILSVSNILITIRIINNLRNFLQVCSVWRSVVFATKLPMYWNCHGQGNTYRVVLDIMTTIRIIKNQRNILQESSGWRLEVLVGDSPCILYFCKTHRQKKNQLGVHIYTSQ